MGLLPLRNQTSTANTETTVLALRVTVQLNRPNSPKLSSPVKALFYYKDGTPISSSRREGKEVEVAASSFTFNFPIDSSCTPDDLMRQLYGFLAANEKALEKQFEGEVAEAVERA
jgi:hypothetical protein